VNILVNNAARLTAPTPTGEVDVASIVASLGVNVVAPFLLTGVLAPRMAAAGGGAIINVGSITRRTARARPALRGAAGSRRLGERSVSYRWMDPCPGNNTRAKRPALLMSASSDGRSVIARASLVAPQSP
jgi:NAD(P)-dependent dehydrogenase (short-subunit alcohol dehydrogenase family)